MRRFLVELLPDPGSRVRLAGAEARHARSVLRLGKGDVVTLIGPDGREAPARIDVVENRGMELTVIDRPRTAAAPALDLTLGLGILKSDKMDLVAQKGAELGLTRLVPIAMERSDVRLSPEKAAERVRRWRRVADQALKQCRRSTPLEIEEISTLDRFLAAAGNADLRLILHEDLRGKDSTCIQLLDKKPPAATVFALVGPEGGFDPEEAEKAARADFIPLGLGPRVLRSETAAMALVAILGFELGDFS